MSCKTALPQNNTTTHPASNNIPSPWPPPLSSLHQPTPPAQPHALSPRPHQQHGYYPAMPVNKCYTPRVLSRALSTAATCVLSGPHRPNQRDVCSKWPVSHDQSKEEGTLCMRTHRRDHARCDSGKKPYRLLPSSLTRRENIVFWLPAFLKTCVFRLDCVGSFRCIPL